MSYVLRNILLDLSKILFCFVFETESHVAQAGLELYITEDDLELLIFLFHLSSSKINICATALKSIFF